MQLICAMNLSPSIVRCSLDQHSLLVIRSTGVVSVLVCIGHKVPCLVGSPTRTFSEFNESTVPTCQGQSQFCGDGSNIGIIGFSGHLS